MVSFYELVRTLIARGYTEGRYYPGTNQEMWYSGNHTIVVPVRDLSRAEYRRIVKGLMNA